MHRYKQIEYKAGATIEVIKCIPRGCRKGADRGLGRKKTPEEMREANLRQAARKLARKINANFRPGDWHITPVSYTHLIYLLLRVPDAGADRSS